MLQVEVIFIEPDETTMYLVGPEGLVREQSESGEPIILAARNEQEAQAAADHLTDQIRMGLMPYGLPLNPNAVQGLFGGGSALRDCRWVKWSDAPQPTGDAGDTLPTKAAVIKIQS